AEVGVLGGERVVGDLGVGARQPAEQGGLAGVGQPDQPGVGDDLQLQGDPAFLAGGARLELARRAVGGRGERLVAAAAAPAGGDGDLLAGAGEVAEDVAAVAVADDGARRDGDDEVLGVLAVAVVAPAAAAGGGAPVLAVDDLGEAVGAGDGADDDVAAVAAVAAVGPAAGDVLLAAEAAATGAAVAGLDVEGESIDEGHDESRTAQLAHRGQLDHCTRRSERPAAGDHRLGLEHRPFPHTFAAGRNFHKLLTLRAHL